MVARQTGVKKWGQIRVFPDSFATGLSIDEKFDLTPLFKFGKSKDDLYILHLSLPKTFECYMVKPHGQLVLVSFIHY